MTNIISQALLNTIERVMNKICLFNEFAQVSAGIFLVLLCVSKVITKYIHILNSEVMTLNINFDVRFYRQYKRKRL
jgi:hypothetical protein